MQRVLFDFFISYKRKDCLDFVNNLKELLEAKNFDVWLDKLEVLPGDSILSGIEKGISSSLAIILVFSEHYFEGWSEKERRAAFSLANSKNTQIVPIWYKIDQNYVLKNAPLLADMRAILYDESKLDPVLDICNQLEASFQPADKELKLTESCFKCLFKKFHNDPDLKLMIGAFDKNAKLMAESIMEGANIEITTSELIQKYFQKSKDADCLEEFMNLMAYHAKSKFKF